MRCLSCHALSWQTFCCSCQTKLLKLSVTQRKVGGLEVYSFFKYQHIQDLLLTKHTAQGFKVYKALADLSFAPFIQSFMQEDDRKIYIIGIDERIKSGYSHVALLSRAMSHPKVIVQYAKLLAQNHVSYAGKSLQYRLENPRYFSYTGDRNIEAILVDDIVTTGTTLQEAKTLLQKHNVDVLFALTLADAKA